MDRRNRNTKKGQLPISLLPEEIRGKIFNKIHQNEVLKLRLVCKYWDQDIRNYYNFRIELDDKSPYIQSILHLRIVDITIRQLEKSIQANPTPRVQPDRAGVQRRSQLCFKHPKLIRRLEFPINYSFNNNYNISLPNLKNIFEISSKSVQTLSICLPESKLWNFMPESKPKSNIMMYRWPRQLSYDFQNLKNLQIHVRMACVIQTVIPDTTKSSAHWRIRNFQISIEVTFLNSCPKSLCMFRFLHMILKLVTKNPQGFEELIVKGGSNIIVPHHRPDYLKIPVLSVADQAALQTVPNIKRIQLETKFSDNRYLDIMAFLPNLIANQRNLVNLNLTSNFPIGSRVLRAVALNNSTSLEKLIVNSLLVDEGEPLDVSAFKNCQKLTLLYIRGDGKRNGSELARINDISDFPELINVSDLPESLAFLEFGNLQIRSRELEALFDSDLLLNLKRLDIQNCGDSEEFGMTLRVFEKVVSLEHSDPTAKTYVMLEGFTCSDMEEGDKFSEIIEVGLGEPSDDFPNLSEVVVRFDGYKAAIGNYYLDSDYFSRQR